MRRISLYTLLSLLTFSLSTKVIFAAPVNPSDINCGNPEEINTAFGCISVADGGTAFINNVLTLSLGIGGGIALLLILYGFYTLTTSAGMPDKVKASQQTITAAVSGLLFIIMSVVLLNLIGVQILNIPGF